MDEQQRGRKSISKKNKYFVAKSSKYFYFISVEIILWRQIGKIKVL
jgi:hypothetical protein